uniref:Uncharacterized protein n=1 Tax=Rhizophora mucronata TaxID=61149 RepID=A0A2P2PSD5_RHIMU
MHRQVSEDVERERE